MKMEAKDWQALYPRMSEAFEQRMRHMLNTLPQKPETAGRGWLRPVLVLLTVLLLSTAAYGFSRPAVVNWLVGNGFAGKELEQTAQTVTGYGAADGISVRMTGAVWDGERLAFSYEMENSEPEQAVLVALDPTMTIAEKSARTDGGVRMVPTPHLDVLPVQRNPVADGGWCYGMGDTLTGEVECTLTFRVYRPQKAFAVMTEPDDPLLHAEQQEEPFRSELLDSLKTLQSFENAFFADASLQEAYQEFTFVYRSGTPMYDVTDAQAQLEETAQINVRFTFDASDCYVRDLSGANIPLENCTADVRKLRLSALTTQVDVRLLPETNTKEAAQELVQKYGGFSLTDENGDPLAYSDMDAMFESFPYAMQMEGQWVCRWRAEYPGVLEFPESVGFATEAGELMRFEITAAEE